MAVSKEKNHLHKVGKGDIQNGVVVKFRIHTGAWSIRIPKEDVLKHKPGELVPCLLTLSEEHQKIHGYPKFVVFQTRVTPTFEIEQTGSGIPCATEDRVKEITKIIEAKNNRSPSVGLVSWAGGFTLGTLSHSDITYTESILFPFPEHKMHEGKMCGYSLQQFEHSLDNPPKLIYEEILPTIDIEEPRALFRKRSKEIREQKIKDENIPGPPVSQFSGPSLQESQFQVLSKSYPETVRLLKLSDQKNARAVLESYQRESFALTGKMGDALTFTAEQFLATVKALTNRKRRKHKGMDPIDFELVAGWFLRGYSEMTPEQRLDALKKKGLHPASSEAIRKSCQRLKLPSKRKPGFH